MNKIKRALIIYNDGHQESILPGVEAILQEKKINFSALERDSLEKESYAGKDIIIVIGGDGTFLRASHLNKDIPMLGINPNPGKKEGFYMQATKEDYKDKLHMALDEKTGIIRLLRLRVEIDSVPLPEYVLNEIFIGDKKPYNVFNYEIEVSGMSEFQRSSGIIIGTPSGSSAWIGSAGGITLNLEDDSYQYIARELYRGKLTPSYILEKGLIKSGKEMVVTCKSPGIAVIDSISKEYELKIGSMVRICAGKEKLPYFMP